MKIMAALMLVLLFAVVVMARPTWALRLAAKSRATAFVLRGNSLSDDQIIERDPWCEVLQQGGDGHSSWGWRDGPIFPAASRVAWDDDPRHAPRLIRVPTNYNATRLGISTWCRLATVAQLDSAKRRRQEAFDRDWRQTGPGQWVRRDGAGSMSTGGMSLGTIMPGETKSISVPIFKP